ncbi:hypothetical protein ABT187_21730 [Streptomyces sp. NPDC001817]|uniref:hypothetical protein n=1 Tax=Streptomyces sp. NPDC001817 TaxID=3154398 RepID=UPI00332F6B87
MQWMDESGGAYGEEPYGGAGYPYAHGHEGGGVVTETATLSWDAAWQTQWTYPLPPVPEPDRNAAPDVPVSEPARPVFVDSSGRRQRRVLRASRLLMIPAGGYVALLISTLLGGPGISAPFVPQPDPAHPAAPRLSAPDSASGTGRPTAGAHPAAVGANPRNPVRKTAAPTTAVATAGPTATPAGTTATARAATRPPFSKGRALGAAHKPVK